MKQSIKCFVVLLTVVALFGCATFTGKSRVPSYPTPMTDEMKTVFQNAENSYLAGRLNEARQEYQSYLTTFGYNEYTDEAKFKLGEIAYLKKDYNTALSYYREAFQNLYNPNIAPKAQFKAALTLMKQEKPAQAYAILDQTERRDLSSILGLRVDSLAITSGKVSGRTDNEMIKWYLFLLDDYAVVAPQDYKGKISEKLISEPEAKKVVVEWTRDANVNIAQVENLPFKDMKGKPSGGYLLYKTALVYYSQGDFSSASKYMKKFVNGYPKHEFAGDASVMLAELKGKTSGKRYKVGVILPLTGKFSLYGDSTLHGIQCAAGLTPPCTNSLNVELIVKDSAGDPVRASQAVEELAKEGAVGIVGPLLSATVGSAARKAQDINIPMISLSQKSGIAEIGDYVFKNALTPKSQVDQLVSYAVSRKKITKFGILYPSNSYGSGFSKLFNDAVQAYSGKVVFQKAYAHSDLRRSKVTKEIGSYSSFGGIVEGMEKKFSVPSGVQALFIPDSYKAVRYVVMSVHSDSRNLPSNIVFMGVNRWNNPGLVSNDIGLLNGSVFVDGFYKGSSDVTTRNFVQNFTAAFGMEPTILEAQAFDSLRIMAAGINQGGTDRHKLKAALGTIKNLGGATGSINSREGGEFQRNLFMLTVKNGSIAELSSARDVLRGTGFSYSKESKARSNAKYDGLKTPNLTTRTDRDKYEPVDFYSDDF